jgi:hypothetical protein
MTLFQASYSDSQDDMNALFLCEHTILMLTAIQEITLLFVVGLAVY